MNFFGGYINMHLNYGDISISHRELGIKESTLKNLILKNL